MITRIQVNGFRSLVNFDLRLKSGLNILVGPNGAGKTNIILFFEFLSSLFETTLAEAVNSCGGAGSIFSKSEKGDFIKEIHAKITGRTISYFGKKEHRWVHYKYEFTIQLSEDGDFVSYKHQKISATSSKDSKPPTKDRWDIVVSSEIESEKLARTNLLIERIDFRKVSDFIKRQMLEPQSRSERISGLRQLLTSSNDSSFPLVIVVSRLMEELREVRADFQGGRALNIVPSIAKLHEDGATPPGIDRDGAGLAATLYHLQRLNDNRYREQRRFARKYIRPRFAPNLNRNFQVAARPNTLHKINEYVTLLNPEILEVGVDKDHVENKLKIFVSMKSETGKLKMPFSLMSDGTVKWISLITAIFTSRNMFAIEEPENFIHPAMQEEILKLMRSVTEQGRKNYFVLMTTHSETLLNAASPEEVIVVKMENGRSITKRPEDPQLLTEEINRSGFGLGFLYLTGVLNDA